jgi:hypothetical protein
MTGIDPNDIEDDNNINRHLDAISKEINSKPKEVANTFSEYLKKETKYDNNVENS